MSEISDFLKRGKFKCNSCGACCKNVWPLAEQGVFPKIWVNKKGGCINQLKNGKCKIYDTRPPYCRVDITLKPKYSDKRIAEMCKTMADHEETKK